MFPPSSTTDEETITIALAQDSLFEPAVEGFYLVVADIQSQNVDSASANNGVALVNIEDIDSEFFKIMECLPPLPLHCGNSMLGVIWHVLLYGLGKKNFPVCGAEHSK